MISVNGDIKKYVIIGNGTAAAGCIEGIRKNDVKGDITVISEEKHHVYSRPLISYYLEGKTDTERMRYRGADFYEKNGCEVYYGVKASCISDLTESGGYNVSLSDGRSIKAEKICVCTGSRPFVPPFEGLDSVVNKFTFMTLDDALGLEKALNELAEGGKKPSVLIVGAGLIGLKCAEGIYDKAGKITVCDLADRVLSSILDAENASIVESKLKECGIDFLLGNSVKKFSAEEAFMNDGSTVRFDVLVLALGVRANSDIVKNAGGNVNRGIVVDTRMRTSLPDVYAAGDCAEGYDSSTGSNRVLAILPNAYMQGFTAGINLSGGDAVFDNAIPLNSIGFFGFHIMTAGSYDGECICANRDGTVRKFFVKDGLLKGFMLLGAEERAGIYTSLIREKVPLDSVSPDFAHNIASNYIFSAEIRRKRLGGAV